MKRNNRNHTNRPTQIQTQTRTTVAFKHRFLIHTQLGNDKNGENSLRANKIRAPLSVLNFRTSDELKKNDVQVLTPLKSTLSFFSSSFFSKSDSRRRQVRGNFNDRLRNEIRQEKFNLIRSHLETGCLVAVKAASSITSPGQCHTSNNITLRE